ncbi:hypothetical protein ARMGADRAFT_341898 [Armillaria gallica]|uniref:Uncharacterized protein n=1 Tax=Armillaria gallica TaxID=47427 RepID=A0A2H3DD70_ARMGA|nr:hypothetical protein ARMGADRAFT_341898 [Armillaria gallica]
MIKDYQQKEIRLRQQAADLENPKVTVREMFDENSGMRRRCFVCARYIYFVSNAYLISVFEEQLVFYPRLCPSPCLDSTSFLVRLTNLMVLRMFSSKSFWLVILFLFLLCFLSC